MASAGGGVGGAMAGSGGSGPGAGSGGQGMQPNGGSGGAGGSGGSTAKRFSCPAGPFPTPMVMSTKNVCGSFAFSHSWNEGPTWIASQKAFFFTNFVALSGSGGDIIKYTPGGNCEVYIGNVGCNGLAASNDGNLLAACQQTRSVVRFDLATKRATPVAETYMGMQLDTPNDLVQHSNGSVYFTNPTNELDGRPVGVGPGAFRVDPSGTVSMIRQGNCNGIALSPDEKKLYVVLSGMWDLDAEGVPSNQEQLFTTGDGMGIDCAGNVYANGSIFTPDGDSIGSWGKGTNLAFGGEDGKTVLVAGPGRELRELTVNVPGLP
jgi:gluconolactonase